MVQFDFKSGYSFQNKLAECLFLLDNHIVPRIEFKAASELGAVEKFGSLGSTNSIVSKFGGKIKKKKTTMKFTFFEYCKVIKIETMLL